MSGDYSQLDKAANEILKELGRDSLTQICERIIDIKQRDLINEKTIIYPFNFKLDGNRNNIEL